MPVIENQGVDVVMHFHDLRRIDELERAVFSLVGQEVRPLRILLALQRFSDEEAAAVQARLAPLLALPDAPGLTLLRFQMQQPLDARSALVNLGFAAVRARHVALLDYDDVLYPEAYRLLTARLRATQAGIAFGRIGVKLVDVFEDFLHLGAPLDRFAGNSLLDLLQKNFCPIHSFMLDRTRVPAEELRFEPQLTVEEDYEFLLRVCASARLRVCASARLRVCASARLRARPVGFRTDRDADRGVLLQDGSEQHDRRQHRALS